MLNNGNSKNTTLIISDIHLNHERAEKIIRAEGCDYVCLLADYFDDFGDNPKMVGETADWLVYSLNQSNRAHLLGNHCLPYAFSSTACPCSGYAQWKHMLISDIVKEEHWNKLKFYYILDDQWLLTHAGLHPNYIKFDASNMNNVREFMEHESNECLRHLRENKPYWPYCAGYSRGGDIPIGGWMWCDFSQEFYPTKGLSQIFGHSPARFPRWAVIENNQPRMFLSTQYHPTRFDGKNNSYNLCLDCKLYYYAIWDGKDIKIKCYADL